MPQNQESKSRFHVGMRNLKTGLAVLLCLVMYRLIGRDGHFLACTSAIICMQDSLEKSFRSGLNRLIGTALGALFGMLVLYLNLLVASVDLTILFATLGIILFIAICNAVGKPDAIVIGCVVFLIIVLQQTTQSPAADSFNRFIDTLFGIAVAIVVNRFIRRPEAEGEPKPVEREQPEPDDAPTGPEREEAPK